MSAFSINITGIEAEIQKLNRLPEVLLKDVNLEIAIAAQDWVAQAKRDAPADVGGIRGAIRNTRVADGSQKIGVYKDYGVYLEFGTKGKYRPIPGTEEYVKQFQGRKPGTWKEFIRNIVRWVHRKGIAGTYSTGVRKKDGKFVVSGSKGRRRGSKVNQFAEDYAVAFLIARSILKKGINPQPYFFKQREIVIPKLIERIRKKVASYD